MSKICLFVRFVCLFVWSWNQRANVPCRILASDLKFQKFNPLSFHFLKSPEWQSSRVCLHVGVIIQHATSFIAVTALTLSICYWFSSLFKLPWLKGFSRFFGINTKAKRNQWSFCHSSSILLSVILSPQHRDLKTETESRQCFLGHGQNDSLVYRHNWITTKFKNDTLGRRHIKLDTSNTYLFYCYK